MTCASILLDAKTLLLLYLRQKKRKMTMTTMMIQVVKMMVPTRQTKRPMTRKQTTTNLRETSTPALKTWMNGLNHYPVRWKVWRKTRKRKRLNDWTSLWLNVPSVLEAGWSDIAEVSFLCQWTGPAASSSIFSTDFTSQKGRPYEWSRISVVVAIVSKLRRGGNSTNMRFQDQRMFVENC